MHIDLSLITHYFWHFGIKNMASMLITNFTYHDLGRNKNNHTTFILNLSIHQRHPKPTEPY